MSGLFLLLYDLLFRFYAAAATAMDVATATDIVASIAAANTAIFDELVQWGKVNGPFAQLQDSGGKGDSCFSAVDAAANGAVETTTQMR